MLVEELPQVVGLNHRYQGEPPEELELIRAQRPHHSLKRATGLRCGGRAFRCNFHIRPALTQVLANRPSLSVCA
jgi:hypothetical protein